MNLLRREIVKKLGLRCLCSAAEVTSTPPKKTLLLEKLKDRSVVRVSGEEVNPFLQGLVTNDVDHLHRGSQSIYALFLNKGGRVLYDSIIYRTANENTLLIECDTEVLDELVKYLKLFRVRRKIDVDSLDSEHSVWVVHGGPAQIDAGSGVLTEFEDEKKIMLYQDPRLKLLGTRVIGLEPLNIEKVMPFFPNQELEYANDENDYKTLRYMLGVGEGVQDHPPSKALPIESNGDYLHGISFQKGCYIGQELTARTYHTGVIRKRLMPVSISQELGSIEEEKDVKSEDGSNVGLLRGHKNGYGLALMRIEKAAENAILTLNGVLCHPSRPFWWPGVMPKKSQLPAAEAEAQT